MHKWRKGKNKRELMFEESVQQSGNAQEWVGGRKGGGNMGKLKAFHRDERAWYASPSFQPMVGMMPP